MPFAETPDGGARVRVHYTREGSGPPLVLVHGTLGCAAAWAPASEALRDRFTVVCPDFAGQGETLDDGLPLTVAALADQVAAAVAHAGVGAVTLFGHSLGAAVAAVAAARHPQLVARVALHAGWVRSDARLRALFGVWGALHAGAPRRFAELILTTALSPAFLAQLDADALAAAAAELEAHVPPGTDRHIALDAVVDVADDLARLRQPVLLIVSDQDQVVTPDHHVELLRALPHAREAMVRAGHGAPVEALDALLEQVTRFALDPTTEETR